MSRAEVAMAGWKVLRSPWEVEMSEQVLTQGIAVAASDLFYGLIGKIPESEADWAVRQDTLRQWRQDVFFQAYWNSIDHILTDTFEAFRRRVAALKAIEEAGSLDDDNFDEVREQPENVVLSRESDMATPNVPNKALSDEFYALAGHIPATADEWQEQQAVYRVWRADSRFRVYWEMLDGLLSKDFAATRLWARAERAAQELRETGYDFDAYEALRKCDLEHANDHLK
jgi:hypothetical protein